MNYNNGPDWDTLGGVLAVIVLVAVVILGIIYGPKAKDCTEWAASMQVHGSSKSVNAYPTRVCVCYRGELCDKPKDVEGVSK